MASVGQEIDRFLGEVESVLTDIPALLCSIPVDDIDRLLLSAEWLFTNVFRWTS